MQLMAQMKMELENPANSIAAAKETLNEPYESQKIKDEIISDDEHETCDKNAQCEKKMESVETKVKREVIFIPCKYTIDYSCNETVNNCQQSKYDDALSNLKSEFHCKNSSGSSESKDSKCDKNFKCDLCPSQFTHASSLKTHRRLHSGDGVLYCQHCDKKFTCSSDLQRHSKTHTGEKSYICKFCGIGFSLSSNLKAHQRIHTGEKPYKCPTCHKGFTQSSDLQKHKRAHTGEKPYACGLCSFSCTNSSNVRRHMRNVHKVGDASEGKTSRKKAT